MSFWSLDLGSSNSALSRWNEDGQHPEMLCLEDISRQQESGRQIEVKYSVPSSVMVLEPTSWKDRLGRLPFIEKRMFLGKRALIGREALEADAMQRRASFVSGFKPYLLRNSFQKIARTQNQQYDSRQIAHLFMRELFAHVYQQTGERPRELAIGTPVDCYEPYRAHLKQIAKRLGVSKVRFVDEPVAAALGYGLSSRQNKAVLVLDFGAGTLDLALILMEDDALKHGRCRVLAKDGAAVGGNHVDSWLLEHFCEERAVDFKPLTDPGVRWWKRSLIEEARSVKERLFFEEATHFHADPPEELIHFEAMLQKGEKRLKEPLRFTREQLVQLLEKRGLYRLMDECMERILRQAREKGIGEGDIGDVLLVGGSTLLPGIYPMVEKRFGRDRVRAWQPFHAVAYGGAVYASGHFDKSDFITHDYALRTYHPKTHDPLHQVIIPRGTSFPAENLWRRQLTPTCALGEPEKMFKLVICEMGTKRLIEQEFVWDPSGNLHALGEQKGEEGASEELIIPLNEDQPALGTLDPPHLPSEKQARLDISFGVNEDRWLVARVQDLKTRKVLMNNEPVVRIK